MRQVRVASAFKWLIADLEAIGGGDGTEMPNELRSKGHKDAKSSREAHWRYPEPSLFVEVLARVTVSGLS